MQKTVITGLALLLALGQARAQGVAPAVAQTGKSSILAVAVQNPDGTPIGAGGGGGGGSSNITQWNGATVSLGVGASDAGTLRVVLGNTEPALPVTGTFWQTTQPVSATALPLPAGAATSATQASQLAAEQATQSAVQGTLSTTSFNRVALTATSTSVPATTSTQVIGANAARKSLQVCGPLTSGATWEIGYAAAASATSSISYGPAGISLCNRWGPADGVPTQAINVYSSIAAVFQVEEGN